MGVGTVYRQTRTLPGRSQEDFEIVFFQPPGQLALDGTFGPFKARASYLLEPAASGTKLTNKWDLQPTAVRRGNDHLLRRHGGPRDRQRPDGQGEMDWEPATIVSGD